MPVTVDPDASSARRRRRVRRVTAGAAALVLAAAVLVAVAGNGDDTAPAHRSGARIPPRVRVLGEQVTRSAPVAPPTTSSPTSTPTVSTTSTTTTRPVVPVLVTAPRPAVATTCADALAYLAAHQAPGFTDVCADGTALGRLGFTCVNQPGMCEGQQFVHIACPAPFVYMNEAHNSWVLLGRRTGIDPYGQGSDAERVACAPHR